MRFWNFFEFSFKWRQPGSHKSSHLEMRVKRNYFRKMAKIVNFLKHESRGSYQFMESRTAPRCHNEEVTLRVRRQTFPGLAWKQPWAQPHWVIVVSDEISAKPRTSNVDGGLEKDRTQSLEQDHPSLALFTLRKLESMPRRIQAVANAHGGHTKY